MSAKIKLFQTVQALHSAGKTKLSQSDLALIERETQDLIRKSKRTAAKVPEGFDELLGKLKDASPEDAYALVLDFMDEKHDEKEIEQMKDVEDGADDLNDAVKDFAKDEKKENETEKKKDEKPDDEDKKDGSKDKKEDDGEKKPFGDDKQEEKKDDEKKDDEKKDEEKGDENGDGPKPGDKFRSKGEGRGLAFGGGEGPMGVPVGEKEKLVAQMRELEKKEDESKIKKFKEDKKVLDKKDTPTKDELGFEDPTKSIRAKKARVVVTPERNIVAYHEDSGPVFIASVREDLKNNVVALKRLANRVYGIIVHEGFDAAVRKCRATRLGGVDDGVITDSDADTPPADGPITDDQETDALEAPETPPKSSQEDVDTDTEEKPESISAARVKALRSKIRTRRGDILEGAETETEEKPDPMPDSVLADNETDTEVGLEKPADDVLEDAEVDFKTAKRIDSHYRKLYSARAKKWAGDAQRKWAEKFARCLKVASLRMKLNQDDHEFKAAMLDVLTGKDIELSHGDLFVPMDVKTAFEVVELAADEGHDAFVDRLLDSTTSLMDKSDEYLEDLESDLETQRPISIKVEVVAPDSRESRKASLLRKRARSGNFELRSGASSSGPENIGSDLQSALSGETATGRRLALLESR